MMDPGQQPTTDDLRDFSRKVRDPSRRQALRAQNDEPDGSRQELDQELLKYRELFDLAPDAYLVTDVYGTIREANVAAARLLGAEARFLAGKQLPSFFDEMGRREYRHQLDHLCDFDRLDDWQIVLRPRHKERVVVAVSIVRASHKETDAGAYRWLLRDVTRRARTDESLRKLNRELELQVSSRTAQLAAATRTKEELLLGERSAREQAEATNRVIADFLALLSHELRTSLQAIFGYTELLERQIHGPLNEAQLGDLRRIQQSQEHLLGLINTILDFARLDSAQDRQASTA